ncbi:MAG TPA: pitrilysin family protein, partial [Vicinamibacterales bacterium]|nr:pitrilysin family protein [Vicinamibacterales bacterium]
PPLVLPRVAGLPAPWGPAARPPRPRPPRPVDFPSYDLRTLPNGLQVLVVPHHEQPSVSFRLIVTAGSVNEAPARFGVASFVAALLTQGTTTRSSGEIATLIDSAGGLINAGSANELSFVAGAVLKDRTVQALELAADLVRNPAFAPEEIERHRRQAMSAMQVGYDDPDYVAGVVFNRLVFGGHPYGRPGDGTPESVARVTRDDLVAFHRTWFVPNNALLAIVGDLSADEAFAAAERAFGSWPMRDVPEITLPALPAAARRIVVVDRPGSAQTEIRVGHLAIARTSPDFVPFDLAVRILGGEGANRLFGVLRSDRGLTYGASAAFRTYRGGGQVVAETDTRTETTGESLRLMVDEFWRLQREAVRFPELRGAQDYLAGSFPLTIETPAAIATQVLAYIFYGLDPKEIESYRDKVEAVTPEDIQRVAKQIMRPDRLSIVLVGDASRFVDQLKALGFEEFDLIPIAELDVASPTLRRGAASGREAPGEGLPPA